MFDSQRPPLLVLPVACEYASCFSEDDGYSSHLLYDDLALIGHKEKWILPLSAEQRRVITDVPLIMVKNSGGVTSGTSTSKKGYAHVFCDEAGSEPAPVYRKDEWMLIRDSITMIWFQYGEKMQFVGDSGNDSERFYYGKLLIRKFDIKESIAPGFDKKADVLAASAMLLRVEPTQIYSGGWNINNDDPQKCLIEIIAANRLTHYQNMVKTALAVSCSD
jgi:hypothetical protein